MYATFSTKASVFNREAPDFKFGFMDYPKPAGGKVANYAGGWAINIPKGAKNPDAAFAFIEHLYLPENDLKWHAFHLRVPVHQSVAKSVDFTNEKQDSDRLQQWLESLDPDEMGKYKM